jgi:hypothetical protein
LEQLAKWFYQCCLKTGRLAVKQWWNLNKLKAYQTKTIFKIKTRKNKINVLKKSTTPFI